MENSGKVITVCGLIEPDQLGKVMMHEHLHSDIYDWDKKALIQEESPVADERRDYLIENAVPLLTEGRERYGLGAYVDVTMPPWRGWPDLYSDVSERSGVHIILATGFYREVEEGTYWVKTADDAIWPFVRNAAVEELTEMCVREIGEGIHGTAIRAGVIKLGTSSESMTDAEIKAFKAGARAQLATGVHITTHCTKLGAESSQLALLEREGVDLSRVVIGHTAAHLANPECRKACLAWMAKGANFLPTNLGIFDDDGRMWQDLVDAIHIIFDAGHGDKIMLGLDSGYCSESGQFGPMDFLPPHPWTHMFTHTLPAFRRMGMTPAEEQAMLVENPKRIIPVT